MKKTLITLLALSGIAMGGTTDADFGAVTGTWTEYNFADTTTVGSNSITLPNTWGGPTSWVSLDETFTLAQDQILTFSYTYAYSHSKQNAAYSISFLGDAGKSAFVIGNTEYGKADLAAAVTTRATKYINKDGVETAYYGGEAQALRFNPGNSTDRLQPVTAGVNLGTVTPGAVTATIAYDTTKAGYVMTLTTGTASDTLNLGSSVSFDTIAFSADGNASQTISNIKLAVETITPPTPGDNVPEPTTATLSMLALAGLAARRRRRK